MAEGKSFGTWSDVKVWLDWVRNAIEVETYTTIKSSRQAAPDRGRRFSAIFDAITQVCEQGVRNGGIAPNPVSPATRQAIQQATGNGDFNGVLSTGYLVYSGPIAEQSQSDRVARKSPPFQVWLKGSGAVHFVDIDVVFEE